MHVVTCTGGERGSILNPRLEHDPTCWPTCAEIRRAEMDAAREILGVRQDWLGWIDSGLPEGDPLPPLPEGCFGLMDVAVAAEPLVRLVRSFRPQVMTTYDENGGYPHPDHIMCHKIAMHAFEAAADPDRLSRRGASRGRRRRSTTTRPSPRRARTALHEAMLAAGLESPYGEWLENWEDREERADHHPGAVRRLLRGPRPGVARARDPGRPRRCRGSTARSTLQREVWPTEDFELGKSVIDDARRPRTTCSPASASTAHGVVLDDRPRLPGPWCGPIQDSKVSPGVLGFLVVAALGVATWFLIRSMNRQLQKIDFSDDARAYADPDRAPSAAGRIGAGAPG